MYNSMKLFIILLIFINTAKANDFVVVANENSFFQPCSSTDNGGNTKMSDLADINIKHEYAEDMETLVSNGNISVKVDIPDDTMIQLDLEIFEKKRGSWHQTIYSIRRPDFCKSFVDPSELWYALAIQIPEEDRVCPPKKGIVYKIENVENRIELPNIFGMDLEGEYKVIAHFIAGEHSTCITCIVNVWKN